MKLQLTGLILLLLSVVFFSAGFYTQYVSANQSTSYHEAAISQTPDQSIPAKIIIARLGIDAQVKPGGIVNKQWILSDTFVHYMSLNKQQNGTLFYAHEREGLFINLKNISKNDNIEIVDQKGHKKTFHVYSIERVKPTDVKKLYGSADTITLYTCDGLFDEFRLVVKAKLQG